MYYKLKIRLKLISIILTQNLLGHPVPKSIVTTSVRLKLECKKMTSGDAQCLQITQKVSFLTILRAKRGCELCLFTHKTYLNFAIKSHKNETILVIFKHEKCSRFSIQFLFCHLSMKNQVSNCPKIIQWKKRNTVFENHSKSLTYIVQKI